MTISTFEIASLRIKLLELMQDWGTRDSGEFKRWSGEQRDIAIEDRLNWALGLSPCNCAFCGEPKENVEKLIAGPGVAICNACIDLCSSIVQGTMKGRCEYQFLEYTK